MESLLSETKFLTKNLVAQKLLVSRKSIQVHIYIPSVLAPANCTGAVTTPNLLLLAVAG